MKERDFKVLDNLLKALIDANKLFITDNYEVSVLQNLIGLFNQRAELWKNSNYNFNSDKTKIVADFIHKATRNRREKVTSTVEQQNAPPTPAVTSSSAAAQQNLSPEQLDQSINVVLTLKKQAEEALQNNDLSLERQQEWQHALEANKNNLNVFLGQRLKALKDELPQNLSEEEREKVLTGQLNQIMDNANHGINRLDIERAQALRDFYNAQKLSAKLVGDVLRVVTRAQVDDKGKEAEKQEDTSSSSAPAEVPQAGLSQLIRTSIDDQLENLYRNRNEVLKKPASVFNKEQLSAKKRELDDISMQITELEKKWYASQNGPLFVGETSDQIEKRLNNLDNNLGQAIKQLENTSGLTKDVAFQMMKNLEYMKLYKLYQNRLQNSLGYNLPQSR